jgi:7,8-dihydroneopterin aldolase/epimerase/oxygenase
MDRITLSGMRYEGRLGATDEERELPQLLEVDLEIELDLSAAAASDALEDTVDYGPLVELTAHAVETGSHKLLEALAGTIIEGALRSSPRIDAVIVRVRKLAVPLDADMDHAQVELQRRRDPAS